MWLSTSLVLTKLIGVLRVGRAYYFRNGEWDILTRSSQLTSLAYVVYVGVCLNLEIKDSIFDGLYFVNATNRILFDELYSMRTGRSIAQKRFYVD